MAESYLDDRDTKELLEKIMRSLQLLQAVKGYSKSILKTLVSTTLKLSGLSILIIVREVLPFAGLPVVGLGPKPEKMNSYPLRNLSC